MVLKRKHRGRPWSPSHLQELIEEACVDAYNESEQEGGSSWGWRSTSIVPARHWSSGKP